MAARTPPDTASSGGDAPFEALRRAWSSLALVFLNTCLLLLVVNLGLLAIFRFLDGRRAQAARVARSPETLSRYGAVHPGLEPREIERLWEETYEASAGFAYEPFTQYRIRPYQGRYVTVDEHGFRRHPETGPWPPASEDRVVFLFGGSTAFGYGVPDDQTVAAHLQRHLAGLSPAGGRVRVYNFGRSGYFSVQERLLFELQLTRGVVPDAAVFLDGLNDCRIADRLPIFSGRLERLFGLREHALPAVLGRLPMMRLARAVVGGRRGATAAAPTEKDTAQRTVTNYLAGRRLSEAAAAAHGVEPLFVWQPVAFYNYDRSNHLFAEHREPPHVAACYRRMAEVVAAGDPGESFLWLGDLQEGLAEPLYVDQAHYSGPMNRRVAAAIGDRLAERLTTFAAAGDP